MKVTGPGSTRGKPAPSIFFVSSLFFAARNEITVTIFAMKSDCCSALLLLLLLLPYLNSLFAYASGKIDGVCISPGGRFLPFPNEGKPPRKVNKGPRDLTLCRMFRKNTCCDVTQTHPAFLSVRRLSSSGEASQECLQLWELLECSICDPHVGTQRGPPVICASFCERVYQACSTAYFSMDTKNQVIAPCGVGDFICGRASEWINNGTELCRAAGFSVKSSDDPEEMSCYGGKATVNYIADSLKTSKSEISRKEQSLGVLEGFKRWVESMPLSSQVSWAVGGMVLTAGLFFSSRRRSRNQRQKHAAIQCTARKLGTRIKSSSPAGEGNRKGGGR